LEFSPDGQFIVSGSDDRTVRIWQWQTNSNIKETAQLKKLLDESCKALRNYLDNSKNISQKERAICPKLASD
jgi:WD40 repeat protein